MKIFGKYFHGYRAVTLIAPLFKMLEAVFELLVPLIVADIIDKGIAEENMTYILHRCLLMFLLAAIGLACSLTAQYFAAKSAMGVAESLRADLFRHIGTFSYTEIDSFGTPTLVTRLASDVTLVQNAINMVLRIMLRVPFIMIGAIVMSLTISPQLTLAELAAVIIILGVLTLVIKGSARQFSGSQNKLDKVTLKLRENIRGVRVVRAFSAQKDEYQEFEHANSMVYAFQIAAGRVAAFMSPTSFLFVNMAIIVILVAGGYKVDNGVLTQGEITALINYMMQILLNVSRLVSLITQTSRGVAGARRIKEVLETKTSMPDTGSKGYADVNGEIDGGSIAVEFDNVTFTYKDAGAPSLQGINLQIKRGETVGIIGGTGSGKTTLVSLICRFYDASEGRVRIFGRDIREYRLSELPGICGIVPQKSVLFAGTIRDNMRFINENAGDDEIMAALNTAQADFVFDNAEGLDRHVEVGGKNFSGGQRQRLAIARTLAASTPILILDDSSSALDYATDAHLRAALKRDFEGHTIFVISQRVATVKDADRIIVMNDGEIAGLGVHDELTKSCDIYKDLCLSQGIVSEEEAHHE